MRELILGCGSRTEKDMFESDKLYFVLEKE